MWLSPLLKCYFFPFANQIKIIWVDLIDLLVFCSIDGSHVLGGKANCSLMWLITVWSLCHIFGQLRNSQPNHYPQKWTVDHTTQKCDTRLLGRLFVCVIHSKWVSYAIYSLFFDPNNHNSIKHSNSIQMNNIISKPKNARFFSF